MIELLQKNFARTVIWGNVGGMTGERMVRSAFAPMLKFSGLDTEFALLCDELLIEEEMLVDVTDAKERDAKITA